MPTADFEKARQYASKILQDNFVVTVPVNVLEIAKNYALQVMDTQLGDEYKHVAGFIDPKKRTIYLNSQDPAPRKNFTIAHELGHWLMHQDKLQAEPEKYAILYRIPLGQLNADPIESEANAFAANLLVPKKYLDQYKEESPEKLSEMFQVSNEVIGYRLQDEYGYSAE